MRTDFPTVASKVYHVRWAYPAGYSLEDLSDPAYNPSTLAETDASFDTTFDDMLIARVVTDSGNVPTITNLANTGRLAETTVFEASTDPTGQTWATLPGSAVTLDWSRTPVVNQSSLMGVASNASIWGNYSAGAGIAADVVLRDKTANPVSRYGALDLEYIYEDSQNNFGRVKLSRTLLSY